MQDSQRQNGVFTRCDYHEYGWNGLTACRTSYISVYSVFAMLVQTVSFNFSRIHIYLVSFCFYFLTSQNATFDQYILSRLFLLDDKTYIRALSVPTRSDPILLSFEVHARAQCLVLLDLPPRPFFPSFSPALRKPIFVQFVVAAFATYKGIIFTCCIFYLSVISM